MSLAEDRAALTYAAGLIGHVVRDTQKPQLEFVRDVAEITTELATPSGGKKFLITVQVMPDE